MTALQTRIQPSRFFLPAALSLAAFFSGAKLQAQTVYTWDGDTSGNWSVATNWVGNATPVDSAAPPEAVIRFDANSDTNLLTTMDLTSGFDLSQIVIVNPTDLVTIRAVNNSSRTIDLVPNGTNPSIDMSAAMKDLTFANQGTGVLTLNAAAAGQIWNVASGRTLTTVDVDGSTTNTVSILGGGTVVLGGTSDNGNLRLTLSGAGTLVTMAKVSSAAFHALGGNAATAIGAGTTLRITGSGNDQIYYQHDLQVDGTFDLGGSSEGLDTLSSGSAVASGVITSSTGGAVTLRINENGVGGTFGGTIENGVGPISLVKAHSGTQLFAGNNTYTGSTIVSRGVLQLFGTNGALSNTSSVTIDAGGELRLENRTTSGGFAAAANSNRLNNAAAVTLQAGTLSLFGVNGTDLNETVDSISATLGYNAIRLSSDATGTNATGLTASDLSRSAGTTVALLADGLGAATDFGTATTGDVAFFRVTAGAISAAELSGASSSGVNRDLVIGVFGSGSTGTTANASDFVTLENSGGFDYLRPLLAAEYAALVGGTFNENNATSGANVTIAASTAVNSLKITAGTITLGAGKTLFLGGRAADAVSTTVTEGSGMLLHAGGSGFRGRQGTIDFGAREANIRVTSGTLSSESVFSGSNGLIKSGTGALALDGLNTFTGTVYVNEGDLNLRNDRGLGASGGGVVVSAAGVDSRLVLSNGVNIAGETITLGASNAANQVALRVAGGHSTWTGDIIAANVNLGGRPDSESQLQVVGNTALSITGDVYGAPGAAPADPTYFGADGNFTRRIGLTGGSGVINFLGTVSDVSTGVAASAIDRLRINIDTADLGANFANPLEVSGLVYLRQGYVRYEGAGNAFAAATAGTDRTVLLDPNGNGSEVAVLLTKAGQTFFRRTTSGQTDIQIGNGGSSTQANALIGGENESGVVTFGNGNQRIDFQPRTSDDTATTTADYYRDLRVYARQGGEVDLRLDLIDDTTTGVTLLNEMAALTKVGLGTVRLTGRAGVNNELDGGLYALGGTLLLDYTTVTNVKVNIAEGVQFTTAGGDLRLEKTNAGTVVERMSGSFTARPGGSEVSINAGTGANLTLRLAANTGATINRLSGSTVNFVETGAGTSSIVLGLAANQNTRVGSWATYGNTLNAGSSWAFISGTNDVAAYVHAAGEIDTFAPGLNTDLTANATLIGDAVTNSLRINNAAVTNLTLGGQLTLNDGGLLVGSNQTAALVISGGSLTAGGTTDLIVHNYGTGGTTLDTAITGTRTVVFAGTGATSLTGTNSFTGTVQLNGGVVAVDSDARLGNSANALYFSGGGLRLTGSGLAIARGVTIGGDGAYVEVSGSSTFSGLIASEGNFIYTETNASTGSIVNAANTNSVGVGDIIKSGAGVLTVANNANTYRGLTDVKAGTLRISLPDLAGFYTPLGSNDSWLDATIIRSGASLEINKAAGNVGIPTIDEWFRFEDGSTLLATGARAATAGLIEVTGALTIDVASNGQLDLTGSGGYLSGNGDITKTGTGFLILLNNNPLYTGALTVTAGILGGRGQGQTTGADFTTPITIGGTGTTAEYRRISLGEFTNNVLVEDHNFLITGTGTKRIGAGNFSAPAADDFLDFNGTVTLETGLELNYEAAGGNGPRTAYLRFNGSLLDGAATSGDLTTRVAGGSATAGASRTGVFELNGDNSDWTGNLFIGNTANNTANLHVVRFGNDEAATASTDVTLRHNSTLQIGGRAVAIGTFATTGATGAASTEVVENTAQANGTLTITQTTAADWDAVFRDGTPVGTVYEDAAGSTGGTLRIVKLGTAIGRLTLDNSYSGGTEVGAGILQVGSGGTAAARSAGDTGAAVAGNSLSVTAAGAMVAGSGTIQGATGTTHLIAGVIAPGDVATGSTGVDPTGIATLDVAGNLDVSTGTIRGQISGRTLSDATLATTSPEDPGYSSYLASRTATWEAGATGTQRGLHDLLNISGQLTLTGDSFVSFTLVNYAPVAGDVFDLIDWTGPLGGSGFDAGMNFRNSGTGGGDLDLPTLAANLSWDVSQFSSNGILVVVVPEPSVAALALSSLGLLAGFRRRRRP